MTALPKHKMTVDEYLARAGLACHMLPDGMTVRVDDDTAHEPDALVYCGERLSASAIEVPNPVIVVEVLSPSTRPIDASAKLAGYFRIRDVQHYLIVVIHHARGEADMVARHASCMMAASLLNRPGSSLQSGDFFIT